MGTPDFAATSLARLLEVGHDIPLVLTQPDKPKNRGLKLEQSPVKRLAEGNAALYQPESLRGADAAARIAEFRPELIVAVAYGKLLPRAILDLPPLGCVNLHASLLPKYRGAAPIQRAVLAGETTTGVTTMYMAEELDAGDMIFRRETELGADETSGGLFARLAILGADVLAETVAAIERGTAPRVPQNGGDATFAPPLTRADSPLDWSRTARELCCQIRGLNPWPAATAVFAGETFKIFAAVTANGKTGARPGSILSADGGLTVACGDGALTVTELQAPGGRRMPARDYLRGHPLT
jgi:methionyl-tRNA formyltransferase